MVSHEMLFWSILSPLVKVIHVIWNLPLPHDVIFVRPCNDHYEIVFETSHRADHTIMNVLYSKLHNYHRK